MDQNLMDPNSIDDFQPAPRRCSNLACRRSAVCRQPFASACPTSPWNVQVRRRRIAERLRQCLRDSGIDPDGPPPADALPIEETLKIIREEAQRRRAQRYQARKRQAKRQARKPAAATAARPDA